VGAPGQDHPVTNPNPSRRGRAAILVLTAVVSTALAAAAAGWVWWQGREAVLTEAPERRAGRLVLPAGRESRLELPLLLPYAVIEAVANRELPEQFPFAGSGQETCRNVLGQRLCVGTRYEGVVERNGPFAVTAAGDAIAARLPLTVTGRGALTGPLARLPGLGARAFRAGLVADARLSLDVTPEWCARVSAAVDVGWTDRPSVEIAEGVWVDVTPVVEPRVRRELERLPERLERAIPCERVRAVVDRLWRPTTIPLRLPGADALMLNLVPRAVGLSAVEARQEGVAVTIALTALTEVGTAAAETAPPLPPAQRIARAPGMLDVSVPVRVGYETLSAALNAQLTGRDLPFRTPAGEGRVRLRDVTVYPAAEAIAVGLSFRARLPGRFLDAAGRAYLVARPVVEDGGRRLRLTDLRLARTIDNPALAFLSAAFESDILAAITRLATIDLDAEAARAGETLGRALADPERTRGIRLSLTDLRLAIEAVAPEADALAVLVGARAGVAAELTDAVRIERRP